MLKGDRVETTQDITFHMNMVAEQGGIATLVTAGSGSSLDDVHSVVAYAAAPSGAIPMGICLTEVVNVDAHYDLNHYKNQVQVGSKVTLLKEGWIVTDMIKPGVSPAAGTVAYVGPSGLLDTVQAAGAFPIGEWQSTKDAEGYAKVYVKLPVVGARP